MKRIAKAKDWSKKDGKITLQPALRRYQRYLEDRMLAASTIESYMNRVKLFLEWAKTDIPSTGSVASCGGDLVKPISIDHLKYRNSIRYNRTSKR